MGNDADWNIEIKNIKDKYYNQFFRDIVNVCSKYMELGEVDYIHNMNINTIDTAVINLVDKEA